MSDRKNPRFEVNTSKLENVMRLEHECSAQTYADVADALAELRRCVEQASAALREGRI